MIQTGADIHSLNYQDFIRNLLAVMVRAGRVIPPEMIQILQGKPLEMSEMDPVLAYINHGRWIVDCPFCSGAELIFQDTVAFLCLSCFNQAVHFKSLPIAFPLNVIEIEGILEKRPMPSTRNWLPDETAKMLKDENKKMGVK